MNDPDDMPPNEDPYWEIWEQYQEATDLPYDDAYWRCVLNTLHPDLAPDPKLNMDRDATKQWMRGEIWNCMKMQDYVNQGMDEHTMAICDARLNVTVALYELAFRDKHDVEMGPALVARPATGEVFHVQSFADAEKVKTVRRDRAKIEAERRETDHVADGDPMPQDLVEKLRAPQAAEREQDNVDGSIDEADVQPFDHASNRQLDRDRD